MKTIEENNKLIAQFMGDNFHERSTTSISSKQVKHVPHLSDLKYHTSWNWLMPVVEKISDIKSWSINGTLEWLSESQDRDGLYNIEDIYQAVVEFIEQQYENYLEEKADSDISVMKDEGLM